MTPSSQRARRSGLVINLKRRPERMQAFRDRNRALESWVEFQRLEAIDGKTLDLDGPIRSRINPWNLENLAEPMLRGVVGCALSHLAAWEQVAALDSEYAFVFEDDAHPLFPRIDLALVRLCDNLPAVFDVIWLSDWDRVPRPPLVRTWRHVDRVWKRARMNPRPAPWSPKTEKTAEAYILSRNGARRLADFFRDNLGAADEHMRQFAAADTTARFLRPIRHCIVRLIV